MSIDLDRGCSGAAGTCTVYRSSMVPKPRQVGLTGSVPTDGMRCGNLGIFATCPDGADEQSRPPVPAARDAFSAGRTVWRMLQGGGLTWLKLGFSPKVLARFDLTRGDHLRETLKCRQGRNKRCVRRTVSQHVPLKLPPEIRGIVGKRLVRTSGSSRTSSQCPSVSSPRYIRCTSLSSASCAAGPSSTVRPVCRT